MIDTVQCSKCQISNDPSNNYCTNCGASLNYARATNSDKKNKLLFTAALIMCGTLLYWLMLDLYSKTVGYDGYKIYDQLFYLNRLIDLVMVAPIFLIYAAVDKGALKVSALIFAIVVALIRLYWNVYWIYDRITSEPVESYLQF